MEHLGISTAVTVVIALLWHPDKSRLAHFMTIMIALVLLVDLLLALIFSQFFVVAIDLVLIALVIARYRQASVA